MRMVRLEKGIAVLVDDHGKECFCVGRGCVQDAVDRMFLGRENSGNLMHTNDDYAWTPHYPVINIFVTTLLYLEIEV